jgi:1-deoxy-D-xylulose-5-phosphate synthase
MDRAGFVGDDGAVHHGFCDQAFLRPMPGIVLGAPSDEAELRRALRMQLELGTASAIRYPRDTVPARNYEDTVSPKLRDQATTSWHPGTSRVLRDGKDVTILAYGALASEALAAAEELASDDIDVEVIDARFCKPLDAQMLERVVVEGHTVVTLEDHALQNGFGTAVLEHCVTHGLPTARILRLGIPDRLVAHATRREQLAEVGLDAAGIARAIRATLRDAVDAY